MSLPTVVPSYVFGLNSFVYNNVHFLDENTVLYPVGYYLVLYNLEKKSQKIVPILLDGDQIGCISVNYTEQYLTIGTKSSFTTDKEDGDKRASIHIFDLNNFKRKKVFKLPDAPKEFIAINYSSDGKSLIAQGCGPEWILYIWSIEKMKLVSSSKSTSGSAAIKSVSCNPFDSVLTHICITGDNLYRCFRFQDNVLKLTHQTKLQQSILSHTWINETTVVCGTNDSKLIIFENGEIVCEIQYAVAGKDEDAPAVPVGITAIAGFSNGLLVGLNNGKVVHFERTNDNSVYRLKKEMFLENGVVSNIQMAVKEDRALVGMSTSQIYVVHFENTADGEQVKFDRMSQSFHSGEILSLDVCVCKPVCVTSGIDKSVRVWNFVENQLEVAKSFSEPAQSISIHPNGLYLVACFETSVRLMAILMDDFQTFWVYNNRNAKQVKFSRGGHYFAIVSPINVIIYNTWSCTIAETIKMGTQRVKCIEWSEFDTALFLYCTDGTIQKWSCFGWKMELELHAGSQVGSSSIIGEGGSLLITSRSGGLKELKNDVQKELASKVPYGVVHSTISGQMLFASSVHGELRVLRYPFQEKPNGEDDYIEFRFHNLPITQMKTSFHERYLLTCGEDGCLWIFKLSDKEGKLARREKDWAYSEEILFRKTDLQECYSMMTDLKRKVEEIIVDSDKKMKAKIATQELKMNEITENYTGEISTLQVSVEEMKQSYQFVLDQHREERQNLLYNQQQELDEIKESFLAKLEAEETRFAALQERQKILEGQWRLKMDEIDRNYILETCNIEKFYDDAINKYKSLISNEKQSMRKIKQKFEMDMSDLQADVDRECTEICYVNEVKIKEERMALIKIEEENKTMKVTHGALLAQIEEHKKILVNSMIETKRLLGIIKGLEGDINSLKAEMRERDDTLLDKEMRIIDLSKKNQELEKFKFVLDYKISELKKQIEPRKQDVLYKQNQIFEMAKEIAEYGHKHIEYNSAYENVFLKAHAAVINLYTEKWKYEQQHTKMIKIRENITKVYNSINDPILFKRKVAKLYHDFKDCPSEPPAKVPSHVMPKFSHSKILHEIDGIANKTKRVSVEKFAVLTKTEEEHARKQLEATIKVIRKNLYSMDLGKKDSVKKLYNEWDILTSEVNFLRKDIQDRRNRLMAMKQFLKDGKNLSEFIHYELHEKGAEELLEPKLIGKLLGNSNILPPIISEKMSDPAPLDLITAKIEIK